MRIAPMKIMPAFVGVDAVLVESGELVKAMRMDRPFAFALPDHVERRTVEEAQPDGVDEAGVPKMKMVSVERDVVVGHGGHTGGRAGDYLVLGEGGYTVKTAVECVPMSVIEAKRKEREAKAAADEAIRAEEAERARAAVEAAAAAALPRADEAIDAPPAA